ncbi:GtrA family protein [Nocardioides limicola]|uniref:GtrA family protein n=1 Tax=Nocardioides limicola TaxID=2803368 RepID=UPI00193AFB77|nr:GtrA family protein [Nocardioides sp. DJM-14]
MLGRLARLAPEAARFLTVGVVATIVALVGFNVLVHGLPGRAGPMHALPVPAYVVANAVGGVLAYLGLRGWAFAHREVTDEVTGPFRFFAIGAATLVIPVVCLAISRYLLGLDDPISDNVSANVIGLGLATVTRFWAFRAFVFLRPEQVRTRPAGER